MTTTASVGAAANVATSMMPGGTRRSRRRLAAACLVAGAAVASCGTERPAEGPGTPGAAESVVACPVPEGGEAAKVVLACAERSLAYIETAYASGTGIVVQIAGERYVATNLHVVEPFDRANVTIDGHDLGPVAFRGADVAADIALLGPVDADVPPLAVSDGLDLERGDDVFLIGYPGEPSSADHEATIASGIVSRRREAPEWDQVYLQSDATISGGQSGGPLFDSTGRLVGMSGLSFADFALSLSGRDVVEAAERVAAGTGDDVLILPAALPAGGGSRTGTVRVEDAGDIQGLYLPASDDARRWVLRVAGADADVSVWVSDPVTGDPVAVNAASSALTRRLSELLEEQGLPGDDLDPSGLAAYVTPAVLARETAPGELTVDVAPGQSLEVLIDAPLAAAPQHIDWTSDQELWASTRPVTSRTISVGDRVDGLLNAFDTSVDHLVALAAGQEVEVWASSPQGDVAVVVVPPGRALDPVAAFDPVHAGFSEFDDSDEGLYGLDVRERFTATDTGGYRFRVFSMDAVPTAFRFAVTPVPAGD